MQGSSGIDVAARLPRDSAAAIGIDAGVSGESAAPRDESAPG